MNSWKKEDLETIPCDLCGGDPSREVVVRLDGLTVVECQRCGLCYVNPRPKASLIARLYEGDYFTKPVKDGSIIGYSDYFSNTHLEMMQRMAEERHAVVQSFVRVRGLRCLEVGCAAGEFANLLGKWGARVVGIDLSKHAIDQARRRYPGVDFRQGDIASVQGEKFDVICAFEVIEHVTSPVQFHRCAAALLKPGGLLFLTTPNYECSKAVGTDRWSGFLTSFEHLYFFSPATLERYGAEAGLAMEDWLTDREVGIFGEVKPPAPVPKVFSSAKRLLKQAHLLDFAKAARAGLFPRSLPYVRHGSGHNLFIVQKNLR